ncbi:hypothetical protein BDU57DRAFT_524686 [Ampelomyces quisqualis]|uniref:Acyl-CoA dehydrogenase/oxidase N-terminal domain-containing protein n=1 Tax=Ampelomyces quisqualis TaxID=50730 RepID=A0A6A5Q6X6_AMPQU|nr:hypothetical protein BDU57DRAFT_524686 [Ampelomyces quisqualis]
MSRILALASRRQQTYRSLFCKGWHSPQRQRRAFSTTQRLRIMETTGFSKKQLTVREAVGAICSPFPNTYWQERDETGAYPKDFHAALAKDGWLGIALPEALGGCTSNCTSH